MICETLTPPIKILRANWLKNGEYPIIDQGQKYICGYTNNFNDTMSGNEYVLFGDHTEIFKYHNGKFAQGADGLKIIIPKEKNKLLPKFLYYYILNFYKPIGGYSRHWKELSKLEIIIPSLKQQQQIINILDKFDSYINDISIGLPKEISLRKQQYEFYRNKLLDFGDINI